MNKVYERVVSSKIFYILLILTGIFFLFSLYHRFIEDDEGILGEYSYYFLHEGIVRLKTMPAILNFDERLFPHHKFYTWSGALIIKIFGWSIYALKTSTLLWYGLFFLLLYRYFMLLEVYDKKLHFIAAAFLIFTAPITILKSFSFRPDVLLMMEGLAVIYFIKKYRLDGAWKYVIIAGAFAGLAFLTHINGVAFCVAGFFLLLILKEFKALAFFTLSGAIVGSFYFIDLLPPGNFDTFIYQLMNWPTVNHGENFTGGGGFFSVIEGRFFKLLDEQKRFFWSDRVLAFSALFLLALITGFKRLKDKDKEIVYYILLLIPALNIFGSHVAERYLVFYYGPMAIITSLWLVDLKTRKSVKGVVFKSLAIVLIVVQLAMAAKMFSFIYYKNYDTTGTHRYLLSKIKSPDAKVLAPYAFIFDEFENYDLYAYKTYEYLQENMGRPMTQLELLEKANELGMDYIILNEQMKDDDLMHWFRGWNLEPNPYYKSFYEGEGHKILRKKN